MQRSKMLLEIVKVILQAIWLTLSGIFTSLLSNLPEIMQLKNTLGYFTPTGFLSLYFGVSTGVITLVIILIKKLFVTM